MIKRPVMETAGRLLVGFRPETYAEAFSERK
jgi:arsenate reductase-like glutaredoxin family protein